MDRRTVRGSLVLSMFVAAMAMPVIAGEPAKKPDLSGPAITLPDTPGPSPTLDGGPARGDKKDRVRPIPHRVLMGAIKQTLGPSAADNLRLSDEQQTKIKAVDEKYRKDAMAASSEARGKGGKNGKGGPKAAKRAADEAQSSEGTAGETDAMKPSEEAKPAAIKDKAKAWMDANGSNADEARAAIWAVLTEPQRDAVKAKLDEFQVKISERLAERETQRKLKKNGAGNLGGPAKPAKKPKGE